MRILNIDKAQKKERKGNNIFYIIMIFIGIILPIAMFATSQTHIYYIFLLIFIEFLISLAILININKYSLKYRLCDKRFKIKQGLFLDPVMILCDSVSLVHTVNKDNEPYIIIVTNKKVRNKYMKVITEKFLKSHNQLNKKYKYLESLNPDIVYYRYIIRFGGTKKYIILNDIYSNCVNSLYTDNAIEDIKIARGNKEIEY